MNIYSISSILLITGIGSAVCACGGPSSDTSSDTSSDASFDGGDTTDETESDTNPKLIYLADTNNYSYESALHIPIVETAASSDIEICWDGLTRDFQCHEMDPLTDIDNVTLVRIRNMTETEIEAALSQGDLQQSNVDGYLELNTDGSSTCVNLSDFSFMGSEVNIEEEYVVSDERKYLLVLTTGTSPGVGSRMMTFMTPTVESTNTSVTLGEGCDLLDFSANMTSLTPVDVPAAAPIVLDWSDIAPPGITRVMIGFYEGLTPADLEAQVLDLMLISTKKWELAIESGGAAALNDAVDETGAHFESFEGDGSWVFALLCEKCQNPAPPFLTLLNPSKGDAK
jgi:hypothetical protein